MAIATGAESGGDLQLDSIPVVDLRLLSQSEIYALSLCSSSAFDPDRCDDVVIPKIDRSVFNESAGSRKQTYSRLRLAPPSSSPSATTRRRTPHLRQSSAALVNFGNTNSDPENGENAPMLTLFKKLFASDIDLGESFPVKVDHLHSLLTQKSSMPSDSASVEGIGGHKRKREETQLAVGDSVVDLDHNVDGCSSVNEIVVRENLEDRDMQILNRDGVAVDFVALGLVEHPYGEEIRRRIEGLGTEVELLGFLKGLKGRWGSSRRKKRIVDASEFGSALPIGWKVLLSVEKKDGRSCLCCARYISPSGRQFVSCKEAASYLVTLNGVHDTHTSISAQHKEIADDGLTSIRDVDREGKVYSNASQPVSASTTSNHEMQVVSDAGFLPEEHLKEILHCNTCNVTYCKKEECLHYQSSVHRRNGYKNVVHRADGVTVNENKSFDEASNSACVNACTAEITADGSILQETHGKCLPLSYSSHDETHGVIENSASIEKPKQNVMSESSFTVHQLSNFEEFPCKIINTVDNTSVSASMGSNLNLQSNISKLALSCDEKMHADNMPCSVGEYMVDEKRSSEADEISLCMPDEMQFGFDSVIPSWNKKETMAGKNDSELSTSLFKELGMQNTSRSSLVALSGLKNNSGADNNEVCGRKMQVNEFEGIKIDPFMNDHVRGNLEQERLFGIDSHDSSFNNRTHEFGSSFNVLHQGMDLNIPRGDNILSSGHNFMVGFGEQSADCTDGSWRTGHENLFQGCFDAVPNPHVQSSSRYLTFDLTSEKAEEGPFGVRKNPNIRTDILRPDRNEPVEYSFMGEQSSNSLPGESKIFPQNSTIAQGSSFWRGKDDLVPNAADTNQFTSVCVWCRSLFYQEQAQTQPGIQIGTIGSLCPSCSTRIPGQF